MSNEPTRKEIMDAMNAPRIPTPRTDAAKEYLKQETAKNDDGDMSLFSVSGVMGVMAECVFLERELAQAKAELYRCQSDRQREHDLRVKFAGEIESLKERYENLMAGVEIGAEARLTETAQHGRHLMELNSKLSASRKDSERLKEALGESSGFVARMLGAFGRQMMQKDKERAETIMETSRDLRFPAMEGGER